MDFGTICVISGIVLFVAYVIGYRSMTPEERREHNAEFRKRMWQASDQCSANLQKWNEERQQIRAAKRTRNTALWGVVGQIVKRL